MSASIFNADRNMHVKIVISALVAAIAISLLGIRAYRSNPKLAILGNSSEVNASVVVPMTSSAAPQITQSVEVPAQDKIWRHVVPGGEGPTS